ncbi:endonuclease IV [Spiroplasma sabaudiense Ar-1343]|uniref:Probable endonuclease 4 n=1 Tax=Spiroplasma sabaudiense Ar-1343 TaxID=1276257 RepID=W6AA20_9MOLU|nr:deoxyribonuclease IV [Spiroplasma sabaudiense]AHI53902.1 endonuclease IV [Spiroplasma sabaudiense Ar-1343]
MESKYLLGCHVSMNKPGNYLVGSVKEALKVKANTFMIFTGAPQNNRRTPVEQLFINEFQQLLLENKIDINNLIVHGPYTINLANSLKPETFEFGVKMLTEEIQRVSAIGIPTLVLHPGSSLGVPLNQALDQLILGLNKVIVPGQKVKIALETMAGKGNEICTKFEDFKYIIERLDHPEYVGVCFDTCHLNDAGYSIKNNFDQVIQEFDAIVGINKLFAVHLNDSLNEEGARKDRHANIGYGKIGFESLLKVLQHPLIRKVPVVLETPWVNDVSPYGPEIEMLKNGVFIDNFPELNG